MLLLNKLQPAAAATITPTAVPQPWYQATKTESHLNNDLARAVVVNDLELPDVACAVHQNSNTNTPSYNTISSCHEHSKTAQIWYIRALCSTRSTHVQNVL